MKKSIYLLIILTVMIMSGCATKEKMVDFMPTSIPTDDGSDKSNNDADVTKAAAPTHKAEYVGETTTKYVKVADFGAVLNVRSIPSTEGEAVGTIKHAEKVEVISIEDGWASIIYNGAICYVNALYLVDEKPVKVDPTTAPTKVPTPTKAPTKVPNTPTPRPTKTPDTPNATKAPTTPPTTPPKEI